MPPPTMTTRALRLIRRTCVYFLKLFICGGPEMAPALPQAADIRLLRLIEGQVEDVEVPQAAVAGPALGRPVQEQGHDLLADAAVGAERGIEAREIVPGQA